MSQTKAQLIDNLVQALSFTATSSAPTNGIYLSAANQLAISTNGSQRLLVDASGNVSIGTYAASDAALTLSRSGDSYLFLQDATSSALDSAIGNSSGSIVFRNGANAGTVAALTERMRLDSSGRLGLGSSSPQAILDVAPDANRNLLVQGKAATTYGLELKNGSANSAGEFHVTAASSGSVVINRGSTEIARFNSTGLGIGTTSPTSALHIDVASGEPLRFRSQTSGSNYFTHVNHAGGDLAYVGAGGGAALGSGTTSDYAIRANQGALLFGTNGNNERARIDTSGRLLVGTSTARSNFFNTTASAALQIEGTSTARRASIISCEVAADVGGTLMLAHQRSGSVGGNTVVQNGDIVGRLSYQGSDGTEFVEAASINCEIDANPGANDMPGRLVFSTTADGASSPTERMRITNGGGLSVGTTVAPNAVDQKTAVRIGTLNVSQTTITNLSTTWTDITAAAGANGLVFVDIYNTSAGSQGNFLVSWRGFPANATVISSNNGTGLTINFQVASGKLQMQTTSGTVSGSAYVWAA